MGRTIRSGIAGITSLGALPNVDQTTSSAIESNKVYWVNTTSSALNLTLPANANKGDIVRIFDVANTFDTNACTIVRNGHLIMGLAENLTISTEGAAFDLVYYNTTFGWRIITI